MEPSRRIPKRKKDLTSPVFVPKTASDEDSSAENSGGSSIRPSFLPPIAKKISANNTAAIIQSCIPIRYSPESSLLVEGKPQQPILRSTPTARQTKIMAENRLLQEAFSNNPPSTHASRPNNPIPRSLPPLKESPSSLKKDTKEKHKKSTNPNVSSVNLMR